MSDNVESNIINHDDALYKTILIERHPSDHRDFRRASLRYHPHVLYRKASLRPVIGPNGQFMSIKRNRHRRSLSSLIENDAY